MLSGRLLAQTGIECLATHTPPVVPLGVYEFVAVVGWIVQDGRRAYAARLVHRVGGLVQ